MNAADLANSPAFPLPLGTGNLSEPKESGGMTLRQHYAGLALQGVIASQVGYPQEFARTAVALADSLIAELAKPVTP